MKATLFALFVALLMVGWGESSQPSESVDMTDTAPKKDAIAWLKKNESGKPFLMNVWFNELQSSWYENGQKKSEGNFKDGKKDGLQTEWYENGQKKQEGNYKDGKMDGLLTYWFKNGQKQGELNYKDGKYHGLWTSWYENGQKETEGNWKDGKLMSMEVWEPNGEKCPVTNVKDGNGGLVLYNEDGTEKVRMTYKDGKVVD